MRWRSPLAATALIPLLAVAACGGARDSGGGSTTTPTGSASATGTPATTLQLGYFANVTHAPALIGLSQGYFKQQLGSTALKTTVFTSGPTEVQAMFAGSIDAAFMGPSSAISAFSKGSKDFVIVAGAASGGAELVVKPSITTVAQLKGTTLASPSLGNTQDIALRTWLKTQGYTTTASGGGDVHVSPAQSNGAVLTEFKAGQVSGAWMPEPYASEMVDTDGGHVLVDEKSLWPNGQFSTTVLVVKKSYLEAHPQTITALITGELQAINYINTNTSAAETAVNASLTTLSGKALTAAVIARAFGEVTMTDDPLASTLETEEAHGVATGLVKTTSLDGILDLGLLNAILSAQGKPAVSDAGL